MPRRSGRAAPPRLSWLVGRTCCVLCLALLGVVAGSGAGVPPADRPTGSGAGKGPRVLIVHDPPFSADARALSVVPALVNLLGHFDCQIEVLESEAYEPGQVDQHDATIYVGLQTQEAAELSSAAGVRLPEALLRDLHETRKPVCWLGANLDQLAARFPLRDYGFEMTSADLAEEYDRVLYQGQVLSRPASLPGQGPPKAVRVTDPKICRVLAEVEQPRGSGPPIEGGATPERAALPYALRSGHFWYFADPPTNVSAPDGSYLALCDQLHPFLGVRHPLARTALLCIKGVHARTSPDRVRELSNLLRSEKVPFAISVTPMYRDPGRDLEVPLSDERRLVGILREAQHAGAAVIADGFTHQTFGRTGEDAEWWDMQRDLPVAGRTGVATAQRIEGSVAELVKCGLFPVAWSTPEGRATPADYTQIAELFSTAWERRLPAQSAREPQVFPFVILRDNYGQRLLPDNLPPLGKDGDVEPILEQIHLQSVVPDPWVTVAISPEAPVDAVRMMLAELRGMDYRLADLRQTSNWARLENLGIYTEQAPRRLSELLATQGGGRAQPEVGKLGSRWDAFMLDSASERGRRGGAGVQVTSFEKPGRDGREKAVLQPGALLVTYPAGMRPRLIFAFEGGPEAASHRLVSAVAAAAMVVGVFLAGALALIYLMQIFLRRA